MPLFKKRLNHEQKRVLDKKMLLAKEKPDTIFDLADIGLFEVPEGVYSLCKVLQKEALLLQSNKLENLKGGGNLHDLCHLKVLDLSHNKLSKLDKDFGCLTNIQRMDLSYNNLKSLPDSIGKMKELEVLTLRGNELSSLPATIKDLKSLKTLDIRENKFLTHLPVGLCYLFELTELLFDIQTVTYPAKHIPWPLHLDLRKEQFEITSKGVQEIKRWLALIKGEEFAQDAPSQQTERVSAVLGDIHLAEDESSKFEEAILKREKEKEQKRKERLELEHQILDSQAENARLVSYASDQRQKVLSMVAYEEMKNQGEVIRKYEEIESNRKRLINDLKSEDNLMNDTVCLVLQISERARNTEALLDELEQDRQRLDELVSITAEESERLRKEEVLRFGKASEGLASLSVSQDAMKKNALRSCAQSDQDIESVLGERDTMRKDLLKRIVTEEEAQKQAVQILQYQKDAKLNRIRKQIEMIEAELVRLSRLEVEKRQETENREMQTLSEMRVNTAMLLSTLIDEQEQREKQLVNRLHEMERLREDQAKDFWLIQYQRLLDSKPQILIDEEHELDVFVVETLLNAGAKEYMPIFARKRISQDQLIGMSDSDLKEIGIHDGHLREEIRAAVKNKLLMDERTEKAEAAVVSFKDTPESTAPSAPTINDAVAAVVGQGECVICLDRPPEMIFLPCGHVCSCPNCAMPLQQCPLCRQPIAQKCRLYSP